MSTQSEAETAPRTFRSSWTWQHRHLLIGAAWLAWFGVAYALLGISDRIGWMGWAFLGWTALVLPLLVVLVVILVIDERDRWVDPATGERTRPWAFEDLSRREERIVWMIMATAVIIVALAALL